MLDKTLESASFKDESVMNDLINTKEELQSVEEDLILKRSMEHFNYEFVFKEDTHLKGFVKIAHKSEARHVGILEWQDSSDPVLYLAEYDKGHMKLHINYGEEGLAIIEKAGELSWRWSHCLPEGYLDLVHEEVGSILMSKMTKQIKLEKGNLATVEAAKRATAVQKNGKTLLENNISLMKIYEAQLKQLIQ